MHSANLWMQLPQRLRRAIGCWSVIAAILLLVGPVSALGALAHPAFWCALSIACAFPYAMAVRARQPERRRTVKRAAGRMQARRRGPLLVRTRQVA